MSRGELHEPSDEILLDVPQRRRGADFTLDDVIDQKLEPIIKLLRRIDQNLHHREPAKEHDPSPADPAPSAPASGNVGGEAPDALSPDALSPITELGAQLRQELLGVSKEVHSVACAVESWGDRLSARLDSLESSPPQETPESPVAETDAAQTGDASDWENVILGSDFCKDEKLASICAELIAGLLAGKKTAQSVASRILDFRSTPAEQLPLLLKDFGEAYYRWRPRQGDEPEADEEAFVEWLEQRITTGNRINLVHRGDRFDSSRHIAPERGVAVVEVRGWIVLREDGKVYTKAPVLVK